MKFVNCGSIYAPVPGLLVSLDIDVELVQEGLDITLVLDGHKASLEVLSEGQIIIDVSLSWWLSDSSAVWCGVGPLPVLFWIVENPLAFASAVLLTPPILFSVIVFISRSNFWLFQHPR